MGKDEEVLAKIMGSCTGQMNYYASNPDKVYFGAKYENLTALSEQMSNLYTANAPSDTSLDERNRTYMTFYSWVTGKSFTEHTGTTYMFSEPFVVGSAYTPLRREDSAVDVVMIVTSRTEELTIVPQEAMDVFASAFCKEFIIFDADEVYVRGNLLRFETENFRITVRLRAQKTAPFAARLTNAMCLYDDFFPKFSEFAFFVQHWFRTLRNRAMETQKLAFPDSSTINLLVVHFLQYYELIPHLFSSTYLPKEITNCCYLLCYTLDDIKKFLLAAYSPILLQAFREHRRTKRERDFSLGELFVMFVFHYGYLIDLPYFDVSLSTTDFHVKADLTNVGLTTSDMEDFIGTEVPDAFQLQHILREAFHIIKDGRNPNLLADRLLRMQIDEAFHGFRERTMQESPLTRNIFDEAKYNHKYYVSNPLNRTNHREVDWFIVSDCHNTTHYALNLEKKHLQINTPENITFSETVYCEQMNGLKDLLKKPENVDAPCGDFTEHVRVIQGRAQRAFRTKLLPNPNNPAKLMVLFTPPLIENGLRVIADYYLEPETTTTLPLELPQLNFVDCVMKATLREARGTAHAVAANMRRNAILEVQAATNAALQQIQMNPLGPASAAIMDNISSMNTYNQMQLKQHLQQKPMPKVNPDKHNKKNKGKGKGKNTPAPKLKNAVQTTGSISIVEGSHATGSEPITANWNPNPPTFASKPETRKDDPVYMLKGVIRKGNAEPYDPHIIRGMIRVSVFEEKFNRIRASWINTLDSWRNSNGEYVGPISNRQPDVFPF